MYNPQLQILSFVGLLLHEWQAGSHSWVFESSPRQYLQTQLQNESRFSLHLKQVRVRQYWQKFILSFYKNIVGFLHMLQ